MINEIKKHVHGLISELEIQGDDPTSLSIQINITDKIQTFAMTEARVYTSTPLKGDQDDYIFCSMPRDQFTESFYSMEQQ